MSKTKLILLAGALCGVNLAMSLHTQVQSKLKGPLAAAPKHFALDLEGQMAGWIQNFQPGPTTNPLGSNPSLTPGAMSITMGISECQQQLDWIASIWTNKQSRKNGAIIACNFNYEAMGRLEFIGALVEEFQLPALDSQMGTAGSITLKVRPERTTPRKVRGPRYPAPVGNKAKLWLCSNFRVSIGNLPCSRISKIDAISFKRGGPWGINFHFNSADAAAWTAMASQPGASVLGRIEFLATDKATVLGALSFKLNRVRGVQPSNFGPGPDGQPRSIAWTAISEPALAINP